MHYSNYRAPPIILIIHRAVIVKGFVRSYIICTSFESRECVCGRMSLDL